MKRWGSINSEDDPMGSESGSSEYGEENDYEMQAEVNVFERVGLPGTMIGTSMQGHMGELQKKIDRTMQDPEERFVVYIDAISRSLDVQEDDITRMINTIKFVDKIGYKNPTAYVLGYLASSGGRNLDRKRITKILDSKLPSVDDKSVTPADVIRYARYWTTLI